jgi:tetratricopeptide (TPR) repeat protein
MLDGDTSGALDEYKEAYLHDQNSPELKAKIASTYLDMGEQEKAEKEILEALKLQENLKLGTSVSVSSIYLEILLTQKEYSKALKVCGEMLDQDPENKEITNYKIALLIELGKKKEAKNLLAKYSKEHPSDEFPYYYMGLLAQSEKNNAEAEKYLLKAISLNPEYEPSLVTLVLLYEKQYSGEKLLNKMEQLSQNLGENNDEISNRIIMLNIKIGGEAHLNRAIEYLIQVYGKEPVPYIAIEKSSLYDKLGEKDSAIQELVASIKNYPKNGALIFALAVLYDAYGKKDEALKAMEDLAIIDPDNAEVLNYIGYTYADKGVDLKKARTLLSKALKLSPDDPYIIDSIAWLNYKEGNIDSAKKQTDKAIELLKQKNMFEPEIIEHTLTIYKSANDLEGQIRVKKLLTDVLNSKRHNDKKDVIKRLLENIDEGPQRSPASIQK